jgi:hypothetical protein
MQERRLCSATRQRWQFGLSRACRMHVPALCALCLVLGSALLASCGDDTEIEESPGRRDAGVSGQGGAAAKSGRPARPQAAGESGSGRPSPPELAMVECGTAVCVSPIVGFGFINACCADEATSICGIKTLSGSCMKPDPGDPRCPALNFRGLIGLPSCCSEDGQCGLEGTRVGMPGCMGLASAGWLRPTSRLAFGAFRTTRFPRRALVTPPAARIPTPAPKMQASETAACR